MASAATMDSAGFDADQGLGQGFLGLHLASGYEPDDDVAEESDNDSVEESDDDSYEESEYRVVYVSPVVETWSEEEKLRYIKKASIEWPGSDKDSIEYLSGSDREKAEEYDRQVLASQGYDLDKPYGWRDMVGGFVPVDLSVAGLLRDNVFKSVEFAIGKENEKRKDDDDFLELKGLLKATVKCCFTVYYVTFVAKSSKKGDDAIYQCQVYYKSNDVQVSEVMEFREKPDTLMSYVNDWSQHLVVKSCGQMPSGVVGDDVEVGDEEE